jgi:DNA-binding NarL/FixJ family response regulator
MSLQPAASDPRMGRPAGTVATPPRRVSMPAAQPFPSSVRPLAEPMTSPQPQTGPTMTTVLIVDDHRIVREGLRQFVSEVPGVERVVTAASGEEALARYNAEQPDLVLMDIQMPGLGGLEATRRLVQRYPEAVVIVLTAADDRENVATAVTNGARGYLNKDVSHEELCAAVATALAGQDLLAPTMRRALESSLASRAQDPATVLTERELQVLRGMSQGKSNAEIGRSLFLSEDTIKTHARRLFRKLGVNDRAQAVALGFRKGYVS